MAITTDFTGLKGDKGDTGNTTKVFSNTPLTNGDNQIILAEYLPSGSQVDPVNQTTFTVPRGNTFDSGGTVPSDNNTDGKDGDVFFDTDDDKFWERGKTTTGVWGETADFTGDVGATPSISFGTVTSVDNSGTASMTLAEGSTDTNPVFDVVLRAGPVGGLTLISLKELVVESKARVPAYVTITPTTNPSTIRTDFPGLQVNFNQNKFNSDTPPEGNNRTQLLFTSHNSQITNIGFQSGTGTGASRYQWLKIDNTVDLTPAEGVTRLVAAMQAGEDCFVFNSTTTNGETWNINTTVNASDTGVMDINSADGTSNLSGVFTNNINAAFPWRGANVAESPAEFEDRTEITTDIARGSLIEWKDKTEAKHIYMYIGENTLSTTTTEFIVDLDTNPNFSKLSA